jgi:hypothetical protein
VVGLFFGADHVSSALLFLLDPPVSHQSRSESRDAGFAFPGRRERDVVPTEPGLWPIADGIGASSTQQQRGDNQRSE